MRSGEGLKGLWIRPRAWVKLLSDVETARCENVCLGSEIVRSWLACLGRQATQGVEPFKGGSAPALI